MGIPMSLERMEQQLYSGYETLKTSFKKNPLYTVGGSATLIGLTTAVISRPIAYLTNELLPLYINEVGKDIAIAGMILFAIGIYTKRKKIERIKTKPQ
jgi:hypothetical protein